MSEMNARQSTDNGMVSVNAQWKGRVTDSIAELIRAINDQGPHPLAHQEIMRKHRAEWPTLWAAIDKICSCR